MKQIIFRYGIIAMLVVVVLGFINCLVIQPEVGYTASEIGGYLTIVVSMIFVFLGIRYYRNHVNNGTLSFGRGMKVGVLIVTIPSVAFGLFSLLYSRVINPEWQQEYYDHALESLKQNTAPEKLQAAIDKLESQRELFSSPVMEFLIMFVTVFVIGLIVTIISSLTLKRNKPVAA
jgi:hypothetical protein